jgi:hypothetical protein
MKFVIEIEDQTVDGESLDLFEVYDATEQGLENFGMVLRDVTYFDSYEEKDTDRS